MSIKKLELTENHVLLLKNLGWSVNNGVIGGVSEETGGYAPPFGFTTIYEAIDLILNGRKENKPKLFSEEELILDPFTDEQKSEWDKLYSELPDALSIILQRGSFELGKFKTKFHLIKWEKIG